GDQWSFLSSVPRMVRTTVEELVRDAERRGRVVGVRLPEVDEGDATPWTAPPSRRRKEEPITGDLPKVLELVLGNEIYIATDHLDAGTRDWRACGNHGIWQDCGSCMADCQACRQYSCAGPSTTVAGSMGGTPIDVSEYQ